ncbi:MAG: hypothetical protein C0482_20195 [Gordonia sp.]|nr:hypothetical protein [Gordonia sp. (in: high G+C Gram-positive bacteria)]
MARAAKSAGRHKKSKSVRRRQRAGVATAAVMTAAMGASVTLGSAPASAVSIWPLVECEAGEASEYSSVNCEGASPPLLLEVLDQLGISLPVTSTAAARQPLLFDPGATAKISGPGVAIANSQLGLGHAEANAWGVVSGAVAIKVPQNPFKPGGSATATSLPLGLTIAVSGEGTAKAVALGGVATAIGDLGGLVENVSCMALFAQASHSDVGSCTGLLFIFTVSQESGVPGYVFAIADPTSLEFLDNQGLIPLPIPNFARDILRVKFGGPGGISFESDLVPPTATSTLASARVAAAPEPSVTAVADESEPAADAEQTYVGKHRAAEPEADVEEEPAEAIWTAPEDVKVTAPEFEPEAEPAAAATTEEPDTAEKPDTTSSTPTSTPPAAEVSAD